MNNLYAPKRPESNDGYDSARAKRIAKIVVPLVVIAVLVLAYWLLK